VRNLHTRFAVNIRNRTWKLEDMENRDIRHIPSATTVIFIVRKHSIATPPAPLGHNWATDAMRTTGRGGQARTQRTGARTTGSPTVVGTSTSSTVNILDEGN
jgi:hypothetical protein